MNPDLPGPPTSRSEALEDLLRDLIAQGIRLIGIYGWTWVDWSAVAEVPSEVLHHALQGRISDPVACQRLIACLGLQLVPDAAGHLHLRGFQVPRERLRAAPTKSTPCMGCGTRGQLSHRLTDGPEVLLACRSCGDERPISLDLIRRS